MTLTVIALGVATALAYGACDFFGGLASRRAETSLAVVALFHAVALGLFAAAMPLAGGSPSAGALAWGGIAGVAGAAGYISYFRALATGRMGVVATVTAVWAAVVPLVVGLLLGERPTPLVWAGIATVLLAITLVTYSPSTPTPPPATATATGGDGAGGRAATAVLTAPATGRAAGRLAAGVLPATVGGISFGGFFVALDRAGAAHGTLAWPLFVATAMATAVVGAVALARRVDWRAASRNWPAIAAAGGLHAAGTWAFIVGVSQGWVSVVAVIAALSPAPTIVLARLFLAERLSLRQLMGAPMALLGIVLITLGLPD